MDVLINTQQFLALSSFLNYQLAGEPVNWRGVLKLMLGDKLAEVPEEIMQEAVVFLAEAYGQQRRRLGPLAVLHPIRATALLVKAQEEPTTIDLLTALFHDFEEDIRQEGYPVEIWQKLNNHYQALSRVARGEGPGTLADRIGILTRRRGARYYEYLGQLIRAADEIPSLIPIKLADRLDNTLDLRIDLNDDTAQLDGYQVVFDILFVKSYKGLHLSKRHPSPRKINGAMRLYQLYKNAVFLSLLRHEKVELGEDACRLLVSLAKASIGEAQSVMLHIFSYHLVDPREQHDILQEVMEYSEAGGLKRIKEGGKHSLDGLFKSRFESSDKEQRRKSLDALYRDKNLMGQSAVAFMVVFANFLHDPEFTIEGISPSGLSPQE